MARLTTYNVSTLYKDDFFRLERIGKEKTITKLPLIIIRGHFMPNSHQNSQAFFETKNSTSELIPEFEAYEYDDNRFYALIADYNHSFKNISKEEKEKITIKAFSDSINRAATKLGLEKAAINGASCGARIALNLTKKEWVSQTVCIAPPLAGCAINEDIEIFSPIIEILKLIMGKDFGYLADYKYDFNTYEKLKSVADWNKVTLMCGPLTKDNPTAIFEKISKIAALAIYKKTGLENDSVVLYRKNLLEILKTEFEKFKFLEYFPSTHRNCDTNPNVLSLANKELNIRFQRN